MPLSSCASGVSPSGEDVCGKASKGFWDVEAMKGPFEEVGPSDGGSRKGVEEDWDGERASETGSREWDWEAGVMVAVEEADALESCEPSEEVWECRARRLGMGLIRRAAVVGVSGVSASGTSASSSFPSEGRRWEPGAGLRCLHAHKLERPRLSSAS